MLADAGYFSDDNLASCEQSGIEPFIPPNRERHNPPLTERFVNPVPLSEYVEPIDKMRHKLLRAVRFTRNAKVRLNRYLALLNMSWASDNFSCEVWSQSPVNGHLYPLHGI